MIKKDALTSYAQYNEDLILKALLYDVKNGFYIDVGANHPDVDSVTKLFYKSGWSGINIEPIKKLHDLFIRKRPKDKTLLLGLSERVGSAIFREFADISGHSTFSKEQMRGEQSTKYTEYKVEISTLEHVVLKYAKDIPLINFIKIDVEGLEYEVIKGGDWNKTRPEVICIEANHVIKGKDWRAVLKNSKYNLFIFDGLNEYYIREESWWRTEGYADRAVKIVHDSLQDYQKQAWLKDQNAFLTTITQLEQKVQDLNRDKEILFRDKEILSCYSLSGQPLRIRLNRALCGVTVDWVRFKFKRKP